MDVEVASESISARVEPMSVALLQTHGPKRPSMLRARAPRKTTCPDAAAVCLPKFAKDRLRPRLTRVPDAPAESRRVMSHTGRVQLVKLSGGGSGGSVVTLEKHHSTMSTGDSSSRPPADPNSTDASDTSNMCE